LSDEVTLIHYGLNDLKEGEAQKDKNLYLVYINRKIIMDDQVSAYAALPPAKISLAADRPVNKDNAPPHPPPIINLKAPTEPPALKQTTVDFSSTIDCGVSDKQVVSALIKAMDNEDQKKNIYADASYMNRWFGDAADSEKVFENEKNAWEAIKNTASIIISHEATQNSVAYLEQVMATHTVDRSGTSFGSQAPSAWKPKASRARAPSSASTAPLLHHSQQGGASPPRGNDAAGRSGFLQATRKVFVPPALNPDNNHAHARAENPAVEDQNNRPAELSRQHTLTTLSGPGGSEVYARKVPGGEGYNTFYIDTQRNKLMPYGSAVNKDQQWRRVSMQGGIASDTVGAAGCEANTPVPPLLYGAAFQRTAEKYNVIIGVRAPNLLSESLLTAGYPSKNFHMKAKSSASGPTAGFIAEDARYSKVSIAQHDTQRQSIARAKEKGALAVDLKLNSGRIQELIDKKQLVDLGEGNFKAQYPAGEYQFKIEQDGTVLDENNNNVKVMTNPSQSNEQGAAMPLSAALGKQPVVADYDLFTLIPHGNQSNNRRPLTIPPRSLQGSFKLPYLQPQKNDAAGEDQNMGNVHFYGQTIIGDLNKNIAAEGYQGGKLVWHNDEAGNPFSPGLNPDDEPIFFIPHEKPVQVRVSGKDNAAKKTEFTKQLSDLYIKFKDKAYSPEFSPRLGL